MDDWKAGYNLLDHVGMIQVIQNPQNCLDCIHQFIKKHTTEKQFRNIIMLGLTHHFKNSSNFQLVSHFRQFNNFHQVLHSNQTAPSSSSSPTTITKTTKTTNTRTITTACSPLSQMETDTQDSTSEPADSTTCFLIDTEKDKDKDKDENKEKETQNEKGQETLTTLTTTATPVTTSRVKNVENMIISTPITKKVLNVEDLFHNVMQFLDFQSLLKCSQVNRQWLFDSYHPSSICYMNTNDLWRGYCKDYDGSCRQLKSNTLDAQITECLMRRGFLTVSRFKEITHLDVYPWPNTTDKSMNNLLKLKKLENLKMCLPHCTKTRLNNYLSQSSKNTLINLIKNNCCTLKNLTITHPKFLDVIKYPQCQITQFIISGLKYLHFENLTQLCLDRVHLDAFFVSMTKFNSNNNNNSNSIEKTRRKRKTRRTFATLSRPPPRPPRRGQERIRNWLDDMFGMSDSNLSDDSDNSNRNNNNNNNHYNYNYNDLYNYDDSNSNSNSNSNYNDSDYDDVNSENSISSSNSFNSFDMLNRPLDYRFNYIPQALRSMRRLIDDTRNGSNNNNNNNNNNYSYYCSKYKNKNKNKNKSINERRNNCRNNYRVNRLETLMITRCELGFYFWDDISSDECGINLSTIKNLVLDSNCITSLCKHYFGRFMQKLKNLQFFECTDFDAFGSFGPISTRHKTLLTQSIEHLLINVCQENQISKIVVDIDGDILHCRTNNKQYESENKNANSNTDNDNDNESDENQSESQSQSQSQRQGDYDESDDSVDGIDDGGDCDINYNRDWKDGFNLGNLEDVTLNFASDLDSKDRGTIDWQSIINLISNGDARKSKQHCNSNNIETLANGGLDSENGNQSYGQSGDINSSYGSVMTGGGVDGGSGDGGDGGGRMVRVVAKRRPRNVSGVGGTGTAGSVAARRCGGRVSKKKVKYRDNNLRDVMKLGNKENKMLKEEVDEKEMDNEEIIMDKKKEREKELEEEEMVHVSKLSKLTICNMKVLKQDEHDQLFECLSKINFDNLSGLRFEPFGQFHEMYGLVGAMKRMNDIIINYPKYPKIEYLKFVTVIDFMFVNSFMDYYNSLPCCSNGVKKIKLQNSSSDELKSYTPHFTVCDELHLNTMIDILSTWFSKINNSNNSNSYNNTNNNNNNNNNSNGVEMILEFVIPSIVDSVRTDAGFSYLIATNLLNKLPNIPEKAKKAHQEILERDFSPPRYGQSDGNSAIARKFEMTIGKGCVEMTVKYPFAWCASSICHPYVQSIGKVKDWGHQACWIFTIRISL